MWELAKSIGKQRLLALFMELVYCLMNAKTLSHWTHPLVVASVQETMGSIGCTFLQLGSPISCHNLLSGPLICHAVGCNECYYGKQNYHVVLGRFLK